MKVPLIISIRTYTTYADDKVSEIEAFKLTLKKNDNDFLTDIYNRQLAELYVGTGENNKALEILEGIIKGTDNPNIIRGCIKQLCRIIISTNSSSDEIAKNSYHIIKDQHKKYSNFSPMVDGLIKDVTEIMQEEKITAHNSSLPKAGADVVAETFWIGINIYPLTQFTLH
ncbi:hypothetical protein [Sphingobacterium sp.]|uniref:hypothetical protein n=1 Tax=Sphingobacterium sp. TaxID=341027 RepID=UPI0028A06296|nr:hypothetical protein [Sphingobacterium sp.]